MSGIYLHIPFCKQACTYCDFHFSTSLLQKTDLVEAIVKEMDGRSAYIGKKVESVYFGGGTPSLLSEQELTLITEALRSRFEWDDSSEITLEANPDDIRPESLRHWKKLGFNRLSIGLQSFNNEELKWMNRAHTAEQSVSSVRLAQDHGFNNISIDLIYGSRFQTPETWQETLRQAIALDTPHISSYNLTIEQKTTLGILQKRGKEPSIDERLSSSEFLQMIGQLGSAGFIQYEISNFGKPGFYAVHNSNYWLGKHYLGLGPSAHSFNGGSRQWNIRNNGAYIRAVNSGTGLFEREELSVKDRYNEYVLTRLRTIWGCDLQEIATSFGEEIAGHFKQVIREKAAYVHEKQGVFTLNASGKLIADGLAADLFFL